MQREPIKKHQEKGQLEPQKELKKNAPQKSAPLSNESKRNFWLSALTAGVIAFGVWSFFPIAPDSDNQTNDEKTEILEKYNAVEAFKVDRIVNKKEIQQAIISMGLEPNQKVVLEKKIENGDMDMAWIQAWDNMSEDGDVLRFESQSYKVTTTIMNKPVIFALPLAKGMNFVTVTGVHDGGGGITASVITSTGATSVPVISQGSSYTLPIK